MSGRPDKTMLWGRIQELTDIIEQAEGEVANAYKEMDEVWEKHDNLQIEMMALESKLEKSMFMSNLWIKGLLGLMTPEQRKNSFQVISRIIAAGFKSKGWELDESEADTEQLEHSPNAEG